MFRIYTAAALSMLVWPASAGQPLFGQSREEESVEMSRAVLKEIVSIPLKGIPRSMLDDAQGIAIIPNVIKGSFVVGARHGRGVLVVRQEDGNWALPWFISLTGGNIGWQIGLQATDLVLVFKTRQSIQGILSGKLTIGADAAAAAGPVGRQASAATDGQLRAEILSYSRSRGLFAGVSVDGSVLQVDPMANAAYYGAANPGEARQVPESAIKLLDQIAAYCGSGVTGLTGPVRTSALPPAGGDADTVRNQLAQAAPQLYAVLDEQWAAYLALPGEVFQGASHPTMDVLDRVLAHFDAVAREPRYRQLAERAEFQSTHGLLKQYAGVLSQPAAPLELPPPPVETGSNSGPARY